MNLLNLLSVSLILGSLIFTSCNPELRRLRNIEKTKRNIEGYKLAYPELWTKQIDTLIISDTIVNDRIRTLIDTVLVPQVRIDTVLTNSVDGVYVFSRGDISGTVKVLDSKVSLDIETSKQVIYRYDTIVYSDTVIVNSNTITEKTLVNTQPNPWLVFLHKTWQWILWFVILALSGLIAYKYLFNENRKSEVQSK